LKATTSPSLIPASCGRGPGLKSWVLGKPALVAYDASVKTLTSLLLGTLAAISVAQSAEKLDLSNRSKVGDAPQKYKVSLKIEENNAIEFSGVVTSKVVKTADKKQHVEMSCADFKFMMDQEANSGVEAPKPTLFKLDSHNLPESLAVQEQAALFTTLHVARFIPASQASIGETIKVGWKGAGGSSELVGESKVAESGTKGGRAAALVKSKLKFTPEDANEPADVIIESWFDLATGALIESKITGTTPQGTFAISVVEQK